jgi:hypothetical protein
VEVVAVVLFILSLMARFLMLWLARGIIDRREREREKGARG